MYFRVFEGLGRMGPLLENLKDVPEKFGDLGGFLVSESDYDVSWRGYMFESWTEMNVD